MTKFKILTLLLFLVAFNNCKAQTPIIPLEEDDGTVISNAYYKDVNNTLNEYEGTWLFTNGNTQFKIVLEKKIMQLTGTCYIDMIIGEVQYIENGTEKANTLDEISIDYDNNLSHTISGNTILTTPFYLNCTDCEPDEKRLSLGFEDPVKSLAGEIVLKKTVVNNQEAIKIFIIYKSKGRFEGESIIYPTIPYGWYTLIKQ